MIIITYSIYDILNAMFSNSNSNSNSNSHGNDAWVSLDDIRSKAHLNPFRVGVPDFQTNILLNPG